MSENTSIIRGKLDLHKENDTHIFDAEKKVFNEQLLVKNEYLLNALREKRKTRYVSSDVIKEGGKIVDNERKGDFHNCSKPDVKNTFHSNSSSSFFRINRMKSSPAFLTEVDNQPVKDSHVLEDLVFQQSMSDQYRVKLSKYIKTLENKLEMWKSKFSEEAGNRLTIQRVSQENEKLKQERRSLDLKFKSVCANEKKLLAGKRVLENEVDKWRNKFKGLYMQYQLDNLNIEQKIEDYEHTEAKQHTILLEKKLNERDLIIDHLSNELLKTKSTGSCLTGAPMPKKSVRRMSKFSQSAILEHNSDEKILQRLAISSNDILNMYPWVKISDDSAKSVDSYTSPIEILREISNIIQSKIQQDLIDKRNHVGSQCFHKFCSDYFMLKFNSLEGSRFHLRNFMQSLVTYKDPPYRVKLMIQLVGVKSRIKQYFPRICSFFLPFLNYLIPCKFLSTFTSVQPVVDFDKAFELLNETHFVKFRIGFSEKSFYVNNGIRRTFDAKFYRAKMFHKNTGVIDLDLLLELVMEVWETQIAYDQKVLAKYICEKLNTNVIDIHTFQELISDSFPYLTSMPIKDVSGFYKKALKLQQQSKGSEQNQMGLLEVDSLVVMLVAKGLLPLDLPD